MTTAARPTFEPARGGRGKGEGDLSALSKQYSSRDLPSHTKLKYREDGQTSQADVRGRDFRRELEEREERERSRRDKDRNREYGKKPRLDPASHLDADDPVDDDDDADDDSDDDDDDTAELQAELEKIRKERAQEMAKMAAEKKAEDERIRTENILRGNPLINQSAAAAAEKADDFRVKRRWDDDVVFKNCAKGTDDSGRRFINDTLRSEFHKKFMEKYVK